MQPVLDDRGQEIRVLDLRALRRDETLSSDDPSHAARRRTVKMLKAAVRAESRRWTLENVLIGLGFGIAGLVLSIVVRMFVPLTPGWGLVPSGLFWGGIVTGILFTRWRTRRRMGHALAATAVARGLCGQCCYSLENVVVDGEGRLTCPECGAAWNATRLTSVVWGAKPAGVAASGAMGAFAGAEAMPVAKGGERYMKWIWRLIGLVPPMSQRLAPDDRDRIVEVPDARLWNVPRAGLAGIEAGRLRAVRAAGRRMGRWGRVAWCILPVAISGIFVVGLIDMLTTKPRERDAGTLMIVMGVGAAFFGLLAAAIFASSRGIKPTRMARVLTQKGLCGSCVRELRGVPPAADGITTCPRCGAGWRMLEGS